MTDVVNNESVSQHSGITTSAPVSPPPANTAEKRALSDDEWNGIIASKKQKAYEKGYEDARTEYAQKHAQQAPQPNFTAPVNPQATIATPTLTEDQMRVIANDTLTQRMRAHHYETLAANFVNKCEANKSKFPEYDSKVAKLDLEKIPNIWIAASEFDDPAAIMYELASNPRKLADVRLLEYSPAMMKAAMQEIADSHKKNEEAKVAPVANAPLSRQKPSTVGIDSGRDKSDLSVSDYQKLLRV